MVTKCHFFKLSGQKTYIQLFCFQHHSVLTWLMKKSPIFVGLIQFSWFRQNWFNSYFSSIAQFIVDLIKIMGIWVVKFPTWILTKNQHTGKSRVLTRLIYKLTYAGFFWLLMKGIVDHLCTVTLWQKVDFLIRNVR